MSDYPLDDPSPAEAYIIRRKGSLYNINGPQGRVFRKYQSARIVGPRWEELTHTPWPYPSSAYEPGLRLWQLGLLDRERVGQRPVQKPTQPEPAPKPKTQPSAKPPRVPPLAIPVVIVLALPAPRIDLREQARLMQTLRRDPARLFDPAVQQALRHEVDYHLPQASWAAHLLKLLDRYERRQRRQRSAPVSPITITAQHVAWQEQQPHARKG